MAKNSPTSSATLPTIRHILDNVLITKSRSDENGVIALVRPDFSVRIKCNGLLPNSSPSRVEIDTRTMELRVWIDDLEGTSRPNRTIKNAFIVKADLMKVTCVGCGAVDVESFIGNTGQNGWVLDAAKKATCPDCQEERQ